jgi:hypothetical protein
VARAVAAPEVTVRRLPARWTALAAALALAGGSAVAAGQGEPLSLESPATADVVDRLVADPRFAAPAEAQRLVGALRVAGGHAASAGLVVLLGHETDDVKATALEAIAALGLRTERTAIAVRAAATSPSKRVRGRAIEALGRVGDGRDVPRLLDGLDGEDPDERSACLRALRTLSGMRMAASPVRWSQWWSKAEPRAQAELQWAAQEMAIAAEAEGDLEAYASTLVRSGWVEILAARDTARTWMQGTETSLRVQGLRLVAALRLADLAPEVASALRFAGNEDAWAAIDAARAIGVPVPPSLQAPPAR